MSIWIDSVSVSASTHPVDVMLEPSIENRNRLTCAFRPLLAVPHLLLVGGPAVLAISFRMLPQSRPEPDWGAGVGVLGAAAGLAAVISWFALVFGGRHPAGLWKLCAYYLRWRVRAVAYLTLLRDEYPPFGDAAYPAELVLGTPARPRQRVTVAFRPVLALPHILCLSALNIAWACTTFAAWLMILATRRYPPTLYDFGTGVLRWGTRLQAYLLLLRDEYPPFSLG